MSLKDERNIGNPMWTKYTGKQPCDNWDRDVSDVSISQECQDSQQISESRQGKKRFSPTCFRGNMVLPTPEFGTFSLQSCDRTNCSYLTTQCVHFVMTVGNLHNYIHNWNHKDVFYLTFILTHHTPPQKNPSPFNSLLTIMSTAFPLDILYLSYSQAFIMS